MRALLIAGAALAGLALTHPAPKVTYSKDVASIVFRHCSNCHRPGEVAPFSLLTYEGVKNHADQIAGVTKDHIMPPWLPDKGDIHFDGERRLSDEEIATIQAWVEAGKPEGDRSDLPPTPKYTEGWQLGKPDLVLKMPEAYTMKAEGEDIYKCFVLPVKLDKDRWVKAVEFRPGNRKIVHHALIYMDTEGKARKLDESSPGPGYTSFAGPSFVPAGGFGGWAPGTQVKPLPTGFAKLLPKGSDVVVQVHYHASGKEESDQSTLGFYFTDEKPKNIAVLVPVASANIFVPAGKSDYHVKATTIVPVDCKAIGLFPHAHYICKEMKGTATLPDGTVKSLILIKDWDFNWQEQYRIANPMALPKGTKLSLDYSYDNSAMNPRNPNSPPKAIHFGPETKDEMAILWVQVVTDKISDTKVLVDTLLSWIPGAGAAGLLLDGKLTNEIQMITGTP